MREPRSRHGPAAVGDGRSARSSGGRRAVEVVGLGYGWLLRGVYGVMAAIVACLLEARSRPRRRRVHVDRGDRARPRLVVLAFVARSASAAARRSRGVGEARVPPVSIAPRRFGFVALFGLAGGRGWAVLARVAAPARGRGVPRRGDRRDAARPLVPRAAGPLARAARRSSSRCACYVWPIEIVALCLPPGMIGVLDGDVDDGYGGLLGWMWVVSAITTIVLVVRHAARAARAVLLGGHGRDRSALPRDPHRVRHRLVVRLDLRSADAHSPGTARR